ADGASAPPRLSDIGFSICGSLPSHSWVRRASWLLLDRARSVVSSLRKYLIFDGLAVLDDLQRLARRRIDEVHLDLAVLAVASHVRRMISERVLVPECVRELAEDSG